MRVLIFGATGMVGQGVLRECLLAPDVTQVQAIVRTPTMRSHPKLSEIVRKDLSGAESYLSDATDFDACFFCLGISSPGMSEADYTSITNDLTLDVARVLSCKNPGMTFVYLSGAGADSTGQSRQMWARVRGGTENALRDLPFKNVCIFRPGAIIPMHGERSKIALYRIPLTVFRPLLALLRRLFPRSILTTELVGRAMLAVARVGPPKAILDPPDIYMAATHSS